MKLFKLAAYILIVFFKTGNLLSENYLFNVDNIILEKKDNISINRLAPKAMDQAFTKLMSRILLKEDMLKISSLNSLNTKELVSYYNITKNDNEKKNEVNFSITFDREKIHELFFKKGISYSIIKEKEFYILPILISEDNIFIFSNNYYYESWNQITKDNQIEFILPLENIETIQNINRFRGNLSSLELNSLFKEYPNNNVALILISDIKNSEKKIYLKSRVHEKTITKNLNLKNNKLDKKNFNKKTIFEIKELVTDLVKSQNLIDVRTPSFINVKYDLSKGNLVLIKSKLGKINLIEGIFVQHFNKDYVSLKVKYLGKIDRIVNELKKEGMLLEFNNEEWVIKNL